jgi:hypothetical protein
MDIRELVSDDPAQSSVQWISLVLAVLKLRVLLPENYISSICSQSVSESHSHEEEAVTPKRRIVYSMKNSQMRSSLSYYQDGYIVDRLLRVCESSSVTFILRELLLISFKEACYNDEFSRYSDIPIHSLLTCRIGLRTCRCISVFRRRPSALKMEEICSC